MPMITVTRYFNYIDAEIAANYLRQYNINAFLADEYSCNSAIAPLIIDIRLMVPADDFERAQELLQKNHV